MRSRLHHLGAVLLEPFHAPVEHLGLAGPARGAGPHGVGQRGEAADLPVLEGTLLLAAFGIRMELGPERGVVAGELAQRALGQLEDLGDGAVQQADVVADDEKGSGVALELGRQPPLGVQVEMVGRLVQDQGVGPGEQDAHEIHAPALTPRQAVDVVEQGVLGEPQPLGQAGDVTFEGVAPGQAVALLGLGEMRHDLLGGIVGQGTLRDVQLLVEAVEAPGRQHVRQPGGLEAEPTWGRHLGEESDRALHRHLARGAQVGWWWPADDRHERGLPRAVAPHQPDLVARAHQERGVAHERPAAHLDAHGAPGDHPTIGAGRHAWPGRDGLHRRPVRARGVEPPPPRGRGPKPRASTNSATPAVAGGGGDGRVPDAPSLTGAGPSVADRGPHPG